MSTPLLTVEDGNHLKREQLNQILTCSVCKKYFLDPVALPCGSNICKEHVILKEMQKNKIYSFHCSLCEQDHETLRDGFPLANALISILELNNHLDEKALKEMDLIKEYESIAESLKFLCHYPREFISKYVSAIQSKIVLRRDTLIERVKSISQQMMNKLDVFKNDCDANLKNLNVLIEKNKCEIAKMEKQSKEWRQVLRTEKLSKIKAFQMVNETKKCVDEKKSICLCIENELLMGKTFNFEANIKELNENDFGGLYQFFHRSIELVSFDGSTILSQSQSNDLVELCEFKAKTKFNLIYSASDHGFPNDFGSQFKKKCQNIPRVFTIIKVNGIYGEPCIYGSFRCCLEPELDMNCFVFSLVNKEKKSRKITQKNDDFGVFASLFWPISLQSLSDEAKQLFLKQQSQAQLYLAGSEHKLTEIEVYKVECG